MIHFVWTIRSFLCVPLGIIGINACILLKLRNRIYNALLCYQYCLNIHVIQVVDTENCDTPTSSLTHTNSRKNFADKNHQMIFTHVWLCDIAENGWKFKKEMRLPNFLTSDILK